MQPLASRASNYAEMDEQLGYDRYDTKEKETDDSRNGHSSKTLRTSDAGVYTRAIIDT